MAKAPKKNLDEIIKETDSQKKVDEICHKAEREIEEVLSSHSQEDINGIRKQLEGCTNRPYPFPTGEISFKGINISLDSIYGQYNIFRKNFEDAKKYNDEQNLPDLANVFRIHAENKLIDFILFLVDKVHDTEGELLINGEEKKLEEFDIEEFKSKLCSRDEVAEQIYKIRGKSISLKGLIQLRDGINIDLSDDKFSSIIREYQQEYDNAKNNNEKAKLDTRLAELLILESGYIIQINNQLLPTRNSNYKKDGELHQNLKICKEGLEKIGISTDAIKFTHNGEKFYAIKKVEKNINKKSKEKKETLGKPTINDIYTDSSKGKEMMKKLIESGTLLVDFGNGNGFEEVSDFNPDMRELRKNTKFKDEDGNIYILDIWDKDTRGKTVRGPFETEPDDYYYHFRKTGTKPETQTETETQIGTETQPETQTETETQPETQIETETQPETQTETETPIPPIIITETETETEIETETETETETEIDLPTSFEENVVLSDVSESYEDMISREVENEINEEWHNTSRYNVLKRGKLFLMRGRVRRKKINEKKKNYERTPFTNNAIFNKEMGTQASRHDLEEILQGKGLTRNAFGNIQRQTMIESNEGDELHETERGKEFKELCQGYISGAISLIDFKKRFNEFVRVRLGLPEEQQFVATNVLEKLNAIKNDNELFGAIKSDLEKYLTDHNNSHFDSIRRQIDANFKKYRKDPRFRKEIMDIMGNPSKLDEAMLDKEIQKFIRHQAALAKLSTENLQIKLDLLRNGKGAYQTSNKDREKGWLFKLGNKLDKMPWWGQALTIAGISVSGMAVGLLGGGALAATLTTSGLIGAKAAVKKFTHHTKEQNTYEKNLTRNYEEEIAKMKEWERIMAEKDSEGKYTNSWFKRYRAKRQLELYGKTTQAELQRDDDFNTKQLSDLIYSGLEHYDTLSPNEKNVLNTNLLDARARLEAYWSMGHNFLRSKDRNQIERDFYDLENALNLSAIHIIGPSATLQDIPAEIEAYYDGKQINYDDLLKEYRKDYNSATKKFRGERAWLATKWGLGTAAISFGTAAAMQAATGTGMFAKEAVPGTPGTPETTSTTNTGNVTDHYGLSQREGGNNILNAAENNISGDTSSVTLHFGAGTDGTPLRIGTSFADAYKDKMNSVIDLIQDSAISNKATLISQVKSGFATNGFTNTDLHGLRCLEAIEETIKGAGNSGFHGALNLSYDPIMNIDGTIVHDAASRVSNAFLEITNVIPGTPGTAAVEGGKEWLVVGLPWFSNTFKRNNDGKPKQKPADNNEWKEEDKQKKKDKQPQTEKQDKQPQTKKQDKNTDNLSENTLRGNTPEGNNNNKTNGGNTIVVPPVVSDEKNEMIEDKNNISPFKEFNEAEKGKYAQEYLEKSDDFKPKYKIQLPNGNDMYISKIIKGGSHKYIVGYTKVGNKMELRLFWKSNSEGVWRAGLGEAGGGIISKGESIQNAAYETTTKVNYSLGNELNKISEKVDSNPNNHPLYSLNHPEEFLAPEFKKEITIEKLFNVPYNSSVNFYQGKKTVDVQNAYKNMKLDGINYENMQSKPDKNYSYEHEYLGKINVEAYTIDRNGKPILIYFSKSEKDNKVWIENVAYVDAKINSFGTYDKQINASPLTAKPIDYKDQAPSDFNGTNYGSNYVDIRDLYQENPIIKKYKELANIK